MFENASWDNFPMHNSECNYAFPIEESGRKHKLRKKELKQLLKLLEKDGYVFRKKKKGSKKKKHHKKASRSALNDLMVLCLPKVLDICGECVIQKVKNSGK